MYIKILFKNIHTLEQLVVHPSGKFIIVYNYIIKILVSKSNEFTNVVFISSILV